ncbi:MAG: hypothetical protein ACI9W2_004574 [Gammaproteobacteria bacterium]|jgi:hypothetical protein
MEDNEQGFATASGPQTALRTWAPQMLPALEGQVFYDLPPGVLGEITSALEWVQSHDLSLASVEPEDVRLPSFSRDVPMLRERLDQGLGFVVIRGVPVFDLERDDIDVIYWALCNYLARVIRQRIGGIRIDTLRDEGGDPDPFRLSRTSRYFDVHTDNGGLEPRMPDYLGLLCVRAAHEGGESIIAGSHRVHEVIAKEFPEHLSVLRQEFSAVKLNVQSHGARQLLRYRVLQQLGEDVVLRYNRPYIEAGMKLAGTPLGGKERAALDCLDDVLHRPDVRYEYKLRPGEILFNNNRFTVHGRTAYKDGTDPREHRELKRAWMWRRHVGPGWDPVELDRAELWDALPGEGY